ncbi:hypothetical protein L218DRAFT_1007662 [Marasmius fiardii PR-910]|nr:hypothetical protein L218DRAFT_1007662 [Marasmius fiardii PR-910]
MAPSKNRHAPTAESPPPVQDLPSASTNVSSVPLLHMHPNTHFMHDTKLYKLLEIIHEAFLDLYIRWFFSPLFFVCGPLTSDDISKLKETLDNNYWDFREWLPLPPKKPSSVKTSKVSSVRTWRVQSPIVVKKEVGTDKRACEPSPGPVNKKPKLDISPTDTLFSSESGESEATVEEDIEEVEAKQRRSRALSKVIKKKMNTAASVSEEQPADLRVIYVPGTEAALVTFKQLATLSTVPSPATMKCARCSAISEKCQHSSKKTHKCKLCKGHGQKCSVVQNLNNMLLVFNCLFQIGLQGPEGLGMLLSQRTQLVKSCHRISGIRVLLDMEVNRIHTQIDELTATIKCATCDPRYVAHMLNSDDPNHLPLSGDEVAILASALEWPTSMFSPEDTEVIVISANKVQVKDKAQGSVIATAPFISGKAEADAATAEALLAFDSVPVWDAGLKDFMMHLKARLNPHHIASDQEAYDLYMAAFNLMQKHLDHGDIIPNLIMLNSIKAFHTSFEEI